MVRFERLRRGEGWFGVVRDAVLKVRWRAERRSWKGFMVGRVLLWEYRCCRYARLWPVHSCSEAGLRIDMGNVIFS